MAQPKLRDQAYEAFAQHLFEGRLVPGQFVSQRELAALTQMSLGAIREMIPRLEAEGLIKAFSQRGLQIVHVDLQMVAEAFQLREMVETTGLAEFARIASDAAIKALNDRFQDIKTRAGQGECSNAFLEAASACDWEMHDTFVAALNNHLIADIHRVNSIRIRMILGDRIGLPPARIPIALREHEAVLSALVRRDRKAAVLALRAHLQSSRRRSLSVGPFDETLTVDPATIETAE
ncbi:MAG: GntR family transcriptional regulator [Azospirillaceae bacterium]|nr:GntR family transcriptional regulator [Azospirillaceae bacterium]